MIQRGRCLQALPKQSSLRCLKSSGGLLSTRANLPKGRRVLPAPSAACTTRQNRKADTSHNIPGKSTQVTTHLDTWKIDTICSHNIHTWTKSQKRQPSSSPTPHT